MAALVHQGVLRPSGAPRWGPDRCAGSAALEQVFTPSEDSPEAREGTAAHHYVMEALEGRVHGVGVLAPNGHPLDAAMVQHGQTYMEDVAAVRATLEPGHVFKVETTVYPHSLVHPMNEGTPDTFALDYAVVRKRLVVWDYKYGHKFVDAYQNWQVIDYIAGIFEGYDLTLEDVRDMEISVRIIQPRNYHPSGNVRVWDTTGAVVWGLIESLKVAAHAAKQPGAPTNTGSWCTDCDGRHACEAYKRVAARAMDVGGENTPDNLPLDALGLELQRLEIAAERIKGRLVGLQELAINYLDQGKAVPGWTKGYVNSKEVFRDAAKAIAFGDLMGADFRKADTVTPNQAVSKLVEKGFDKTTATALIKDYSFKPTGAAKLLPVANNAAAKAFGEP
jgi:hypothetical protein